METYTGHVRTPADAIILFEACRLGLLPRVQRRLSEKERQNIKSGSVFVWDEREAGMRRWTDGKSWSASRVSGSFLTYREMEGKRGGNGFAAPLAATRAGKTPDSTRGSDSDLEVAGDDGHDGYRYKPDGLMKQSFSITTSSGNHLHLISYYARSHPNAGGLCNPSTDPSLRNIQPQKGMYPESSVHEQQSIPAVTRAPMASAPYSTIPHMAGYARSGAPQHHMYTQPGYGWAPQSPVHNGSMQTGNGNGYHPYDYQHGPHGPPPSNGYSPLSHSQSANPTSQPQQTYSPQPQSYGRSPAPHYDRSPVPNDSLPPPPQRQSHHHRISSAGSAHQQHYSHPSERPQHLGTYSQQPPPQHAPHAYEQQQRPPHYPHPYSTYPHQDHSPYQQTHQLCSSSQHYTHTQQPPPQTNLPTRAHSQTHASSSTPIDPRLMAPSPHPHSQLTHSAPSRTPSPHPTQPEAAPNSNSQIQTNGVSPSQASTIPSIGSIMNGPPPPPSNTMHESPADTKSDRAREKSRSQSPRNSRNNKEGKRDAVHRERAGPNEDVRQLQRLNRAFRT